MILISSLVLFPLFQKGSSDHNKWHQYPEGVFFPRVDVNDPKFLIEQTPHKSTSPEAPVVLVFNNIDHPLIIFNVLSSAKV